MDSNREHRTASQWPITDDDDDDDHDGLLYNLASQQETAAACMDDWGVLGIGSAVKNSAKASAHSTVSTIQYVCIA